MQEEHTSPSEEDAARLRVPPQSIEAEQSLLGGLMMNAAPWGQVTEVLVAGDFYRHEHRTIFAAIAALAADAQPVDTLSVFEQLQRMGNAEEVGGLAYLNAMSQVVPSSGNMRRYAEIIAERSTLRQIIAQADTMASAAFRGNTSAADVLDAGRSELLRIEQQRKTKSRRVPLLNLAQLQEGAQAVRWLIKHVMPAESIGMLYGASGTFKSFIALDAALHVAHGLPWLGRKTQQGPVVYIAAEGGTGLWPRVHAWHRARGLRWQDVPLYVVPMALDLRAEAWRVVEAVQALGLTPAQIVVDTLSQTYSGEENSADEMAGYLRELGTRFRALWACTVLLIHHSGHSVTERPRGSSAIRANVDFLLGVFRDEKEMLATLTCEKQKDVDPFGEAMFSLAVHTLGTDEDGDRVTSLVARHLTQAEEVAEAMEGEQNAGRGGKNQLLLKLVSNGMKEADLRKAFFLDCGIQTPDARRQAYFRAKKWATDHHFIEVAEGYVISLKKDI